LKISNWFRNRVPWLTGGYPVTPDETGYSNWLLEKKNNNKTSLMKKKKKENFLNERKSEYIYIYKKTRSMTSRDGATMEERMNKMKGRNKVRESNVTSAPKNKINQN
jgi:hypothetical protein